MTKRFATMTAAAAFCLGLTAGAAWAEGMPDRHGQDGRDFGASVSEAAQDGGIGDHASGGKGGGMPDAHGQSGRDFGGSVSDAAQDGGMGDHASGGSSGGDN
ncbi:hypothetical protein C882_0060 [Caenispirillum salinarum AK4]|uniref:Uncharacterized protein n=1 Tax=Caenispirillum salinarum AK4 TaxID=1238182 RepID=K9GYX1_9PROT|nr:hypothetical protein [Caenispirillum salinarum]EKV29979.1 hypothetical protein C882_0060 [Caenispirillum salinarum AK4]